MAALDTVTDYVAAARVLLQDAVVPYRYPDVDLVRALNLAMLDARRLRPDLFLPGLTVPFFTAVDTTAVVMDAQYRTALMYYIVGHVQLRDDENTQDARAASLVNKFTAQLLSTT